MLKNLFWKIYVTSNRKSFLQRIRWSQPNGPPFVDHTPLQSYSLTSLFQITELLHFHIQISWQSLSHNNNPPKCFNLTLPFSHPSPPHSTPTNSIPRAPVPLPLRHGVVSQPPQLLARPISATSLHALFNSPAGNSFARLIEDQTEKK